VTKLVRFIAKGYAVCNRPGGLGGWVPQIVEAGEEVELADDELLGVHMELISEQPPIIRRQANALVNDERAPKFSPRPINAGGGHWRHEG
jgi:hypothetical protein